MGGKRFHRHGTPGLVSIDWRGELHARSVESRDWSSRRRCGAKLDRGRLIQFRPQKTRSPHNEEADFLLRVFPRERRYAELGYLLPVYFRPTVKNPVCRPFLLARQLLIAYYGPEGATIPQAAGMMIFAACGFARAADRKIPSLLGKRITVGLRAPRTDCSAFLRPRLWRRRGRAGESSHRAA